MTYFYFRGQSCGIDLDDSDQINTAMADSME